MDCSSCEGTGKITEELQTKTREKYQTRFANFSPTNAITIPLIVVNIAVFAAIKLEPSLLNVLSLNVDSFPNHHYWAVLTPYFTHYSLLHIGLNLLFLWSYGPLMEGLLGKKKFLILFLLSGLGATGLSWLGNIVLDDRYYAGVGASGPLYGLVGAMAALHLRWRMIPAEEAKRLVTWAAGLLLLGFALRGTSYDLLDNWAHLGGALSGFLLIYFLPRPEGH